MLDWFLREERFSAISAFVLNVCNSNNSGRLFEVPISVLLLFARLGGKYLFQLRVALEPWCFECFWILLIGVTKVSLTLSFSLKPHTLSHSLFVFFLSHAHCVSFSLSLSLSLSLSHTHELMHTRTYKHGCTYEMFLCYSFFMLTYSLRYSISFTHTNSCTCTYAHDHTMFISFHGDLISLTSTHTYPRVPLQL